MPLINRDTDYALRALLYIARNNGNGLCSASDIAQQEDITPAFTRKILQRMAKKGIVGSRRGPKGGFFLRRKPTQISIHEVMETVQGKFKVNLCILNAALCRRSGYCVIRQDLLNLQGTIVDYLKSATLGAMLKAEQSKQPIMD